MDRLLCLLQALLLFAPLAAALKFDLHAVNSHESAKHERCIRNFVAKDQLVVVTAIMDGFRGDGQTVNMHVCGPAIGLWLGWNGSRAMRMEADEGTDPRCDGQ